MIRTSLNELLHMTRKAMLGCGFSHDIAEDTGWAMVMASPYQPDAICQLADDLFYYQDHHSEAPVIADNHRITIDNGQLYLQAKPYEMLGFNGILCDWLTASEKPLSERNAVILKLPYMPIAFLGHLLWTASQYNQQVVIEHHGRHLRPDQMLAIKPDTGQNAQEELAEYRITMQNSDDVRIMPAPEPVEIDDTGWSRLSEFAFRSYVPESEASRLSGAGAGLTDND